MCVRVFIPIHLTYFNLKYIYISWKLNSNIFTRNIRHSGAKIYNVVEIDKIGLSYVCSYKCTYVSVYVRTLYYSNTHLDRLEIK